MTAYRAAKGIRKTLFLGIILLGLGQGLFSQNSANSQEAPLVTRGDFVLRGSVLVKYTGNGGAVVIPGNLGITEIADNALNADGITSVTIPEGVKTIGSAFGGENSLREIRLPTSLTTIGDWAFAQCWGLTSVVIPNSVSSIGNGAFSSCHSLTSIEVDGGNPQYASAGGVLFTKDRTALIQYPAGKQDPVYTIPNTVKSIRVSAFYNCDGLTVVVIPNSVVSIGDSAFNNCDGLTSVVIPNSIVSIGRGTFNSCGILTSVVIPNSVKSIESGAFWECFRLTLVVMPANVNLGSHNSFDGAYNQNGKKAGTYSKNGNTWEYTP